ncbi:hypothetical protein HAX54_050414, partial [Datura stramonium]|nr:hypothetical protein [Datura stramonium]
TMASRADKGKKVEVASKGFKRLRKGVASSSSAQKHPLLGGLEPRPWRNMGLSGHHPRTGAWVVFAEPEECNLTLMGEFHVNWNTLYGESTKIK